MGISNWKTSPASSSEKIGDQQLTGAGGRPLTELTPGAGRYLAIVTATIAVTAASFVGLLLGLDLSGSKPPPAFSNSYCFDAKLASFRQDPPVQPTHLIVGSSVPWRNVAAETIAEQYPDARPLNASFCGLVVNQSAFAARFFLERFPTITDVLLVLDPFDMSACRSNKTAVFDAADVSAYLSGANDLEYYFKYFDIVSLIGNAFTTANASSTTHLVTRLGDGPLYRSESHELVYGPPPAIQPACEAALTAFAEDVENSGKHLVVATMPLLRDWSDKYDSDSRAKKQLAGSIRRALDGTSATFWDGWSKVALPRADYSDAVHLHWRAVPDFTRQLAQATGFGARAQ
jgi:hypothetical protein